MIILIDVVLVFGIAEAAGGGGGGRTDSIF